MSNYKEELNIQWWKGFLAGEVVAMSVLILLWMLL